MVRCVGSLSRLTLALIASSFVAHLSLAQTTHGEPYTATLTCGVTEPWSREVATPAVEERVVVVPALGLDRDLRAMARSNEPAKFLGRVGLGIVEVHIKGLAKPTRLDFVQTQAGSLSGMSIEGIAYEGIAPVYAVAVDVWKPGKPIRLYTLKSSVVGTGSCQ